MAKGAILELRSTYGFIQPSQGRERVFFHRTALQDVRFDELEDGIVVEYEAEQTDKGLRATFVRLSSEADKDAHRFLNPYNFVRYLNKPTPEPTADSPEQLSIWRCPPPPHDRYVGLSGRITCAVEAETPLFISDSHAVDGDEDKKGHKSYRFFQVKNIDGELEPALPASSLRGMVRSVFEAVTNSCFAVLSDQRLEFRERPEYGNKVKDRAGIVNTLPDSNDEGEIVLCYTAKVGAYYIGKDQWKNVLDRKPDGQLWQCGDWAIARAKRLRQGYVVRELSTAKDQLQPLGEDEKYLDGWLKITGKDEGTTKKSEFLFLNPDKHGCPGVISFGIEEMREYNSVLLGQRERGELPASPQSSKLSRGDLVWMETKGKGEHRRAKRIVRVQVPRVPYKHTIGELLPDFLHHCDNYDALCTACRVFGWVREGAEDIKRDVPTAYAGRVRFSHGTLTDIKGMLTETPLAILSTPKPTTTEFYLLDSEGKPDFDVDYDDKNARLRGRKFYRHYGEISDEESGKEEYRRPEGERDNQNRTVRDALKKGATFTFTVDFENLAPLELGALLYALELEDGLVHRLGYAKPLGFGSVKVTVDQVERVDWPTRLKSLAVDAGWQTVDPERVADLKDKFLQTMRNLHGDAFDNVLADLQALLGEPPDDLPVHYPRTEPEPDPEGKNYEWFEEHKQVLPLAPDDKRGFSYKKT